MKNRTLILSIFLLISVNCTFLWMKLPDGWDFVFFSYEIMLFIILSIIFLIKLISIIRGKNVNKHQNIKTGILGLILLFACIFPTGIIRPNLYEADSIMTIYKEGTGKCLTIVSFKENGQFIENSNCVDFGVENKGTYKLRQDTFILYFESDSLNQPVTGFGTIQLTASENNGSIGKFYYLRKQSDTISIAFNIKTLDIRKIRKLTSN